jgi:hypothetical protein
MWIVGKPGGPSGPFYSIVSDTGEVIAMQIPSKKHAERIVQLEKDNQTLRIWLVMETGMSEDEVEMVIEDGRKPNPYDAGNRR